MAGDHAGVFGGFFLQTFQGLRGAQVCAEQLSVGGAAEAKRPEFEGLGEDSPHQSHAGGGAHGTLAWASGQIGVCFDLHDDSRSACWDRLWDQVSGLGTAVYSHAPLGIAAHTGM